MIFMSLCDWKCSFMTARKVSFQPDFIHQKDDVRFDKKTIIRQKLNAFQVLLRRLKL